MKMKSAGRGSMNKRQKKGNERVIDVWRLKRGGLEHNRDRRPGRPGQSCFIFQLCSDCPAMKSSSLPDLKETDQFP